jgi:hypothetical protein
MGLIGKGRKHSVEHFRDRKEKLIIAAKLT